MLGAYCRHAVATLIDRRGLPPSPWEKLWLRAKRGGQARSADGNGDQAEGGELSRLLPLCYLRRYLSGFREAYCLTAHTKKTVPTGCCLIGARQNKRAMGATRSAAITRLTRPSVFASSVACHSQRTRPRRHPDAIRSRAPPSPRGEARRRRRACSVRRGPRGAAHR